MERLQGAKRMPRIRRIANHDTQVVLTALDALRLLAVEGLPDLPPHVGEGQSKCGAGIGER